MSKPGNGSAWAKKSETQSKPCRIMSGPPNPTQTETIVTHKTETFLKEACIKLLRESQMLFTSIPEKGGIQGALVLESIGKDGCVRTSLSQGGKYKVCNLTSLDVFLLNDWRHIGTEQRRPKLYYRLERKSVCFSYPKSPIRSSESLVIFFGFFFTTDNRQVLLRPS